MQTAYLDNSATTRVCAPAAERALYMMTQCYGNPSSLHSLGAEAFRELETSRRAVARLIGARPEELTFTSGGTEANNLAVLGAARFPAPGRAAAWSPPLWSMLLWRRLAMNWNGRASR